MKLIKQTRLRYQAGSSDKVYEVDLCEIAADQFVVNFRYGRFGSNLREGTKTTSAVSRVEADKIYDELVKSKLAKGYRLASTESMRDATPSAVGQEATESPVTNVAPERVSTILGQLTALAPSSQTNSNKLSRLIWRAGELELKAAAPLIQGHVGRDSMTNYCVAWSLGRIGSSDSIAVLEKLASNTADAHVAAIATESLRLLVDDTRRAELIDRAIKTLPEPLGSLLLSDSEVAFTEALVEDIGEAIPADILNTLYFIDRGPARRALLEVVKTVPLMPPYFRPIRRLLKAAELRKDAELFGILAYRFETTPPNFRKPNYTWRSYQKPSLGESPAKAFSDETRHYFRRRIWRVLRRMAEDGHREFVPMAVGVLLPFRDQDARAPKLIENYSYRRRQVIRSLRDEFGGYWAFSQLLFRNSQRFVPCHNKYFCCAAGVEFGSESPEEHEAPFISLWKAQPTGLLHLLMESECRHVHEFAVKVLRECHSFCLELPITTVVDFLNAPYHVTSELGLELAVARYNKSNPDFNLVAAIANCSLPAARVQAKRWIDANRSEFFADLEFVYQLMVSPFEDTRQVVSENLYSLTSRGEDLKVLVGRLIVFMLGVEASQAEIVSDLSEMLLRSEFRKPIETLSEGVILDLLASDFEVVQQFGASAVLNHKVYLKQPTEPILRGMLGADSAPARLMALKIIGDLPMSVLKGSIELLASLLCHPQEDLRVEARKLVQRVVGSDRKVAQQLASELIHKLLTPGAPQGVPSSLSSVLREDFGHQMSHVESSTVLKLLRSRSGPAQEVGGFLLRTNVDPDGLTIAEIVRLADHPVQMARAAAWEMYQSNVERIRADLSTAVRILDSNWDDSRAFGFEFIKTKTREDDLSPSVLISICDSVRVDVQAFGRELITRRFKSEDGPEYLLKLSEHPSVDLQLFVSNLLVEYASGAPDRIEKLEHYFVSILSRVNKSRVAKDRVLAFLRTESQKDIQSAKVVGRILDRISATCAIGDRASSIESMLALHEVHPEIELPLRVKKPEVR